MKRIFQLTALLAVMLLMSAPAWSLSYTDHVSQAPNGKGDVLIFPTYLVLDGTFQTDIQVINTSETASAVAKVVIRSAVYSQEVRDFLIFLSPTDMWEGTLKMKNGEVVIYSEDDSTLLTSAPTFASPASPFEYNLVTPSCGDTEVYGYAEVFLAYVFDENDTSGDTPVNLTKPIVTKANIYNSYIGSGDLFDPAPTAGNFPAFVEPESRNILAGNQQIKTVGGGWSAALNATVLKDYGINDTANTLLETTFGAQPTAANNILEVEAALSKNMLGMPYNYNQDGSNLTLHFFNFPTKLMNKDKDAACSEFAPRGKYVGFPSVDVEIRGMDMKENTKVTLQPIVSPIDPDYTTFDEEVSFWWPKSYEKGWYRYKLDNGPTGGQNVESQYLTYTGAPVIPFTMNFGVDGFSTMYGFWTDGIVTAKTDGVTTAVTDRVLEGFQYVNSWAYSPDVDY